MDDVADEDRHRVQRQSLEGQDDQKAGRYDKAGLNVAEDGSDHAGIEVLLVASIGGGWW